MQHERLYHISEEGDIDRFVPRPSPSYFQGLNNAVVFAISERLLHNYLLPRDCPRVCYYATETTTPADKESFFSGTNTEFIVAVEEGWRERIMGTTLYCYELPIDKFVLLDESAGYYISYQTVQPLSVTAIDCSFTTIASRKKVALRLLPTLLELADAVAKSTLNFSLIRMRNARENKE